MALAFAAVARLTLPLLPFFMLWLSPMAIAMGFDVVTRGRVHRVDAISTAVLAIAFVRVLFVESEGWLFIGRAMLQPFL